ncbi:hypothetical protein KRP22_011940 [Phytophthora ramorum]|nr:hypothetical protein KRP22_11778 [Phytophthora ramorum]KAH7501592.1 hypothetical protein KRP22_9050 [Phytophthora ramorum]
MPSDSEYEPGSDGDSDEHTDDYDDEEVEGDRAESPKDEYIEIAENDCAAVGDATGGTGCVYAEKESGEEAVDAKKNPGEDDAVVENDAEAEKAPKTSGGEDAEDAEAETENATQVPEDVGTENTTRIREHNHYISEDIYRALCRGEAVDAQQLGATVDILRSADVPMRNLAEFLCAETDCDLSNQDVRNYCKARYGGPDTERKLLRFMDEFVAIPGNYAFILREYDDVVSGLVLVNEAQRDAYRRWGDALLLDWTYNVNNLGFLLGEFMVTAPNGKGFSVCEMLVSNQQKNTIQECISFFLRVVGECITESITIDKDFNEWRILEAQFPRAKV